MSELEIHPLIPDRWPDLERLFGPRGAQANCWCMYPRLSSKEFGAGQAGSNRLALLRLVAEGPPPGLIAYRDGEPVGWVAVRPREEYLRIQRSRVTKPVDDLAVWSVVCFVVARRVRRSRVASALLEAAIEHARAGGAVAVEGYPVEPASERAVDAFVWQGLASMFRKAGFQEVARRSPTRPLMRKLL